MFRRQSDRTPTLYYEQTESESEEEDHEQDDDYFSVEPVEIDNEEDKEDHTYCEKDQDVTGAAEVPADDTAKKSEPGDNYINTLQGE